MSSTIISSIQLRRESFSYIPDIINNSNLIYKKETA